MRQETSFFLAFIMLFLSIGCSNTQIVQPDKSVYIHRYGTLYQTEYQKVDIKEFYTYSDSILAIEFETNNLLHFHKSEVKKIVMRNRSRGAKHGAIAGALVASSLCYLLCPDNSGEALGSKEAGAFIWFIFGAPLGAAAGFIQGSNDIYEFIIPDITKIESEEALVDSGDVQIKQPDIAEVKETTVEAREMRERLTAASKREVKQSKFYLSAEYSYGFGNLPVLANPASTINIEESGSGIGVQFYFGYALKPIFYLGLSAGGFEDSQEIDDITTVRSVTNFEISARYYPEKKKYFYKGAVGLSVIDQKARLFNLGQELYDASILGMRIIVGMGRNVIQGETYEIYLGGDISYNRFEDGEDAVWLGISLGGTIPSRFSD